MSRIMLLSSCQSSFVQEITLLSSDVYSSAKRAVILFAARVSGSLLTLVYTVMLAQVCSPAEFGLAMTGLSAAVLLSLPLSLNIESGSIKFLVGYKRTNTQAKIAGFIKSNLRVIIQLAAVLLICALAVQVTGAYDFSSHEGRVFALAGLTAPVLAVTRAYGRHATAFDSVLKGALPRMFIRPSLFFVIVAVLWSLGSDVTADFVMFLFFVATSLTAGIQSVLLRTTFAQSKAVAPDYCERSAWIRTGFMLSPLVVMRENLNNLAIVSSAAFLSKQDVGVFSLALSMIGVFMFAVKAVDISISPKLSRSVQHDRKEKTIALLAASAVGKLLATGAGALALILLGETIFDLFGPDFSSVAVLLPILFVLPVASAVLGQAELILNVKGHNAVNFLVSLGAVAVIAVAVAFSSAVSGLSAAALALALVYLSHQLVLWHKCRKKTGIDTSAWIIVSVLTRSQNLNGRRGLKTRVTGTRRKCRNA